MPSSSHASRSYFRSADLLTTSPKSRYSIMRQLEGDSLKRLLAGSPDSFTMWVWRTPQGLHMMARGWTTIVESY